MMTDGIHEGLSREQYEALPALNWSLLKEMLRSPAHFQAARTKRREVTDAMRLGSGTHVLALEPAQFFHRFGVWDGERRAGNEWKKFQAECTGLGREVLTEKQYRTCQALAQAALRDEQSARYLRGGAAEASLLWTYSVPDGPDGSLGYSVRCKGRPDFASRDIGALVDLKTTADASPKEFGKSCSRLGYAAQAAFYVDGYEAITGRALPFFIVAVESNEPYVVQVYRLPESALRRGRALYRTCLDRVQMCERENRWDGYASEVLELELPSWDRDEADDTDISGLGLELTHEGEAA